MVRKNRKQYVKEPNVVVVVEPKVPVITTKLGPRIYSSQERISQDIDNVSIILEPKVPPDRTNFVLEYNESTDISVDISPKNKNNSKQHLVLSHLMFPNFLTASCKTHGVVPITIPKCSSIDFDKVSCGCCSTPQISLPPLLDGSKPRINIEAVRTEAIALNYPDLAILDYTEHGAPAGITPDNLPGRVWHPSYSIKPENLPEVALSVEALLSSHVISKIGHGVNSPERISQLCIENNKLHAICAPSGCRS